MPWWSSAQPSAIDGVAELAIGSWLVSLIAGDSKSRWTASDRAAQAPETAQTARRSDSAAAAGSAAPATLREAVTSADAGLVEGRAEIVDGARPARRRRAAGGSHAASGRAGRRGSAGSVAPTTAPAPLSSPAPPRGRSASPATMRGDPLVKGDAVGVEVEQVAAPGWRCGRGRRCRRRPPRRDRRAAPASRRRASGLRVAASAPRPRDLAPRGLGGAEERVAVGGGADRHVAALTVGDHQQARVAGRGGDGLERRPAGRPERLEAGELWLDRDAGRAGALDQLPADGGAAAAARSAGGSPARSPPPSSMARRRAPGPARGRPGCGALRRAPRAGLRRAGRNGVGQATSP